ncbi:hypothetical protein [Desulfotomaculum copahuensis]|uniref:hypothetical protein n=1 Tax=Desulfotomaculum copahuensis TaxID=1838280 RepID=UPI000A5541B7|nr:hypothetical protein [Desulfotomaculum copahuensis]
MMHYDSPAAASIFLTCPLFGGGSFLSFPGGDTMQDLFTYASLGTLAGAVAATVLAVMHHCQLSILKFNQRLKFQVREVVKKASNSLFIG